MIMKNKRGAMVLRDILFILVVFGGILALSSLFVGNMASEYSNADMNTEYYVEGGIGSLGNDSLDNVGNSVNILSNETGESVGAWDVLSGMVTALKTVLLTPVYIGDGIDIMLVALRIPNSISNIIGNICIILIYIVIVMVIMSAFLRGGKV